MGVMETELFFLGVVIIIFAGSFFALMKRIKKQYKLDREHTERVANIRSLSEVVIGDANFQNGGFSEYVHVPPPYTEMYLGPPPIYDEIFNAQKVLSIEAVPVHKDGVY